MGIRYIAAAAFLWLGVGATSPSATFTLKESLRAARSRTVAPDEYALKEQAAAHEAAAVEGAFDPVVFSDVEYGKDKSQDPSSFAGRWREKRSFTVGSRKLFGIGLESELSYSLERTYKDFPPPEPAPTGSQGGTQPGGGSPQEGGPSRDGGSQTGGDGASLQATAPTPGQDPSQFQDVNPAVTSAARLTLKQHLWRNFGAREVELQEKAATGKTVDPAFRQKIVQQDLQARVEHLYWSILRLKDQIELTRQLVAKAQRYKELTAQRMEIGRADQVDLAQAEADLVAQQGNLLDLRIEAEKMERTLAHRLAPDAPPDTLELAGNLRSQSLPLPATKVEEAQQLAYAGRYDLAMLQKMKPPVEAELALSRERRKPRFDFVASAATTGLEETGPEAAREASEGTYPVVTLGFEFEMPLGDTKNRQEIRAAKTRLAEIEVREKVLRRKIRRELAVAYHKLSASFKRRSQATRTITTLERQLAAERRKFEQARSEKVIALRYEMEVLGARIDRIDALYHTRLAEADIRHLLHEYPTE